MRKVSRTVKKGQTPVPAVQRRACGARRESQKGYRARKSGPCRHRRALSPPGCGSKSFYRRRSDPAVQKLAFLNGQADVIQRLQFWITFLNADNFYCGHGPMYDSYKEAFFRSAISVSIPYA